MGYIDRKIYQRKMVDKWMRHIEQNYKATIPCYFQQWITFDNHIANRTPLVTTTDYYIHQTQKIFQQIKITQLNRVKNLNK